MTGALALHALRGNWRMITITIVAVSAMLYVGLDMYQGMDLSIYAALPDAMRALLGIPAHADAAVLAYSDMLATIGALAFSGAAIAVGSRIVASDEASGRLSLILAAPVSRRMVAGIAAVVLVALVGLGSLLLGVLAGVAPRLLSIDVGSAKIASLVLHVAAGALFHGCLAFALATATGRRAMASGVAATVMVGGWLAAGLLPMWKQGAADWVPWNWINGSTPLVDGVDAGRVALLTGGSLIALIIGIASFSSRELLSGVQSGGLTARLRSLPVVGQLVTPMGHGRTPLTLQLAAQRTLVVYITALLGLVMGVAMPPMYRSLGGSLDQFAATFPQSMADLFGGGNLATAAGFLHLETFGMVAPLCVIVVACATASAGIAGEESQGRLSLLLAQPISRARVYGTVALAMAIQVVIVSLGLFLGMWLGLALSGVDVSIANLAQASVLLTLLGWFFGSLALMLSAATGSPSVTVWGCTAAAACAYFGYTLLLASGNERWGLWSPFAAYLHGPALAEGMRWWQPSWLAGGALLLLAVGWFVWGRRDLRGGRG